MPCAGTRVEQAGPEEANGRGKLVLGVILSGAQVARRAKWSRRTPSNKRARRIVFPDHFGVVTRSEITSMANPTMSVMASRLPAIKTHPQMSENSSSRARSGWLA